MSFGEYFKQLRKANLISQRELARRSGISDAEISRIQTSTRQSPSPEILRTIAPILNISHEQLMHQTGYLNNDSAFISENKETDDRVISIITPKLVLDGWSVELKKRGAALGDIVAKKGNAEWQIDCKHIQLRDYDKHFKNNTMICNILWKTYGSLAVYVKSPITKFTIPVCD